jgi:hypothetical protein
LITVDHNLKLKGNFPMTTKTLDVETITAHEILELAERLSPSDLRWLNDRLTRLAEPDKRESQHLHAKISPSPEVMDQLEMAVDNHDGRTYRHLMDQIDWFLAPADVLNRAIGLAIHVGDMRRSKILTELGLKRFPDHQQIARTALLFHPRPARVAKTTRHPSLNWFRDSMQWIQQHVGMYEIGHWLAVSPGELVADAPTRDELEAKLDMLEERKPVLIYKVIP